MNPQPKFFRNVLLAKTPAIAALLGLSGGLAFAAGTASDTASNYAPSSWSTSPPNLGSGFGAWNITQNNNNSGGPFVGTYLDTGSSVTSGGFSWGTYANSGANNGLLSITRPFTAGASGSSSLYYQTFSVNLSSDGVGNGAGGPPNSELSISIGNAFSFSYFGTGTDNFLFSVDGGPAVSTPVGFGGLHAGIDISLSVSGPLNSSSEGYTFTVTPVAGGSPLFSQSGNFDSSSFNTSSLNLLDSNNNGNGYFNNPLITVESVPEPSTLALLGASGLATLFFVRRRR